MCDGDAKEKAEEFYDLIQDNKQDFITCNDKHFKPNLMDLFNFACQMPYKLEPKYGNKGLKAKDKEKARSELFVELQEEGRKLRLEREGKGKKKGNGKAGGKGKDEVKRETVEERKARMEELREQWYRGEIRDVAEFARRAYGAPEGTRVRVMSRSGGRAAPEKGKGKRTSNCNSKEAHELKKAVTQERCATRPMYHCTRAGGARVDIGPHCTNLVERDNLVRSGGSDSD